MSSNYSDIIIVHMLPDNTKVCGGVKVHYQLSELESELEIQSFIAFPDSVQNRPAVSWFKHDRFEISYSTVREWYANRKRLILIGWEDPSNLLEFQTAKKICYIQGFSFLQPASNYYKNDIGLWVSSNANLEAVLNPTYNNSNFYNFSTSEQGPFAVHLIRPFLDSEVFYYDDTEEVFARRGEKVKVLIQKRKSGAAVVLALEKYLPRDIFNRLQIILLEDVAESEFAKILREADIFIAHSFPEGLGLPALEAMLSRTFVVGFTGRGGDEFLIDGQTGLRARDGDYEELASKVFQALNLPKNTYNTIIENAEYIAILYNREHTKQDLIRGLHNYAII